MSNKLWFYSKIVFVLIFVSVLLKNQILHSQETLPLELRDIGSDAVWRPEPWQEVWTKWQKGCRPLEESEFVNCITLIMRKAGAPKDAIEFTRIINGSGYLDSFEEMGVVDLGGVFYPSRLNDNGSVLLVNGVPKVIDVNSWEYHKNIDITKDPLYPSILEKFPQAELWAHAILNEMKQSPQGGQRFIFTMVLLNGCHACEKAGYAVIAYDFDSSGTFQGTSLIKLLEAEQQERTVKTTDIPIATSFGMPIGWESKDNIDLLSINSFENFNYSKIRFNDDGDDIPENNEWYVSTAHNQNRWLDNGWNNEPSMGESSYYCVYEKCSSNNYAYHPGEDWNASNGNGNWPDGDRGAPIYAIADGIVLFNDTGYGNTMIIVHKIRGEKDSYKYITSLYGHRKSLSSYQKGDKVSKGDEIGNIGTSGTGSTKFPHLHFEIRKESMIKIDPGTKEISLKYPAEMWPAKNQEKDGDHGQAFIGQNYYNPRNFLANQKFKKGIAALDEEKEREILAKINRAEYIGINEMAVVTKNCSRKTPEEAAACCVSAFLLGDIDTLNKLDLGGDFSKRVYKPNGLQERLREFHRLTVEGGVEFKLLPLRFVSDDGAVIKVNRTRPLKKRRKILPRRIWFEQTLFPFVEIEGLWLTDFSLPNIKPLRKNIVSGELQVFLSDFAISELHLETQNKSVNGWTLLTADEWDKAISKGLF